MAKVKDTFPKTFRPTLISRIGVFFILVLLGFVHLYISSTVLLQLSPDFILSNILGMCLMLLFHYLMISFLWFNAEYVFHFAIVVTHDGLWFHGHGKRFYTWDSMLSLSKKGTWSSYYHGWGIQVTDAQTIHRNQISKWLVGNWFFDNFIPLDGIVKVPRRRLLFRDIEAFKKTEFGQELFHFAPHLFDEDGKEKRKNHLRDTHDVADYDIVSNEDYQDMGR